MSKTYKLWVEIEEYDTETDEYRNITQTAEAAPVPIGTFDTLTEAVEVAKSFDCCRA